MSFGLLILARFPEYGRVKTRLAEQMGKARALKLYQALLCDVVEEHHGKGYSTYVGTDEGRGAAMNKFLGKDLAIELSGTSLRGRESKIWNGVKRICRFHRSVIILCADTPGLYAFDIVRIQKHLSEVDVVVGPNPGRGSYYLLGMSVAVDLFSDAAGDREPYLPSTVDIVRSQSLELRYEKELVDLDEEDDIRAISWKSITGWSRTKSFLKMEGYVSE